jgi:hypothetical protein
MPSTKTRQILLMLGMIIFFNLNSCKQETTSDKDQHPSVGKRLDFRRSEVKLWDSDIRSTLVIQNALDWKKAWEQTSIASKQSAITNSSNKPISIYESIQTSSANFESETVLLAFSGAHDGADWSFVFESISETDKKLVVTIHENRCQPPLSQIPAMIRYSSDMAVITKSTKEIVFNIRRTNVCV